MKEISCMSQNPDQGKDMLLKTRIFELSKEQYKNLYELARTMQISVSQIHGVYQGKHSINQEFIVGAIRAFPEHDVGDLFYFTL